MEACLPYATGRRGYTYSGLYLLWAVLTLGCTYREQAPRLAEAHKVYVPYCTSDAHLGDAEAFGMQVNM